MKVMVYDGPRKLRIAEAEPPALGAGQVRVKSICSGISHGTEMSIYRGLVPFFHSYKDEETGVFVESKAENVWTYPVRSCDPGVWYMGYSCVGKVVELGAGVTDLAVGDIVYTCTPHQSEAVVNAADAVKLPDAVPPAHAVVFNNLRTAFNGILDAEIKLGDTVIISGLGVLGQLGVQMAKMSGAMQVIGLDVIGKRREVALANGADAVFDPSASDNIAYDVRKYIGGKGADAVLEMSGNLHALQAAIKMCRYNGVVTATGWYQGPCTPLDLSGEFHNNRITLRSSQTCGVAPAIADMWDDPRKTATCVKILERLKLDNLITQVVPYADVRQAYELVDTRPADVIQVVLQYE